MPCNFVYTHNQFVAIPITINEWLHIYIYAYMYKLCIYKLFRQQKLISYMLVNTYTSLEQRPGFLGTPPFVT